MNQSNMFTIEQRDDVLSLVFSRKDSLNILSRDTLEDLLLNLQELENRVLNDLSLRFLIITGTGKAFLAGADIKQMTDFTREEAIAFSDLGNRIMNKIEHFPIPVIAAVNGHTMGGGMELLLACDVAVGVDKALFALPETSLALFPGFGGIQRLLSRISMAKAKEIVFSSRKLTAAEMKEMGILIDVVESEKLIERCDQLVDSFRRNGPSAIRYAKKLFNFYADMKSQDVEASLFGEVCVGSEAKEGMSAFIERRKADWSKE